MTSRMTALVFSAMLVVAFLMPWFTPYGGKPLEPKHLLPQDSNVTGYEVHRFGHVLAVMERGKVLGLLTQRETHIALYLIYLAPLIWAWTFITSLVGKGRRTLYLIAGGLPVAGFAALIALYGHVAFKYLTYGAYLTVLGGVGILIAAIGPGKRR